jgi:hypothetical protein
MIRKKTGSSIRRKKMGIMMPQQVGDGYDLFAAPTSPTLPALARVGSKRNNRRAGDEGALLRPDFFPQRSLSSSVLRSSWEGIN